MHAAHAKRPQPVLSARRATEKPCASANSIPETATARPSRSRPSMPEIRSLCQRGTSAATNSTTANAAGREAQRTQREPYALVRREIEVGADRALIQSRKQDPVGRDDDERGQRGDGELAPGDLSQRGRFGNRRAAGWPALKDARQGEEELSYGVAGSNSEDAQPMRSWPRVFHCGFLPSTTCVSVKSA